MIGSDLSNKVKEALVKCLQDYAYLCAWSAAYMYKISPDIACHHLSINLKADWVAQRRRSLSDEKDEAVAKAVDDLIRDDFVKEAKYTTWLSNVVLVRKANGKRKMCVDYTNLNKDCPKAIFVGLHWVYFNLDIFST